MVCTFEFGYYLKFVIWRLVFASSFMTRPAINAGLMLLMTFQAPAHFDIYLTGDALHRSDFTVAGVADESRANMHHMREIDMIRHAIDPDPGDRFLIFPVRHQLFDLRRLRCDEQMTGTTVRNRGDTGDPGFQSCAMTVETGDGVVAGMFLMAECYGLDG